MVDFVRETPIDVRGVAARFNVATDTVRRWMKRGLDHAKLGGTVYTSLEAVQRFSGQSVQQQPAEPPPDADTLAALKELKRYGITAGR